MILLLFFLALSTVAYIYHLKLKQIEKGLESIPGPPLLPFIGNALEFGTNNVEVLINLKRLAKQYGPVVRLCLGPQVFILLSEPKYIAQVMNSSSSAEKPDTYKLLEAVAGDGLITSSGKKWRKHRKIIEPMFNSKEFVGYMKAFNENCNKLVERLKPTANCDNVDITGYVYDCTMKTIFSTSIHVDTAHSEVYQNAMNRAFDLSVKRIFSLYKKFDLTYKFTSEYRLLQKYKKIIQDYTDGVIAKRKQDLAKNPADTSRFLFLDNMLRLSGDDSLTDEEIRDEAKTIILAGSDTIGGAMSFGLFELAKHPDVQKKILEETNLVLGKDKSADVSVEDAQNLRYTERVYKEILRKYPQASFIARKLQKQTNFDNFVVPAGAYIIVFIAGAHMSEKDFPNPEEFDPERHLPENVANRHSHAFMPFGAGPRICLGQKYSTLEAKVMLAKIIRNFEITPVYPEHKLVLLMSGTLKSANGIPIKLKIRENV